MIAEEEKESTNDYSDSVTYDSSNSGGLSSTTRESSASSSLMSPRGIPNSNSEDFVISDVSDPIFLEKVRKFQLSNHPYAKGSVETSKVRQQSFLAN